MAVYNPLLTVDALINSLVVMDAQHTTELTTSTNVSNYENVMQINWPGGSRIEIRVKTMSKTPAGVRLKNPLPAHSP